MPVIEIQHVPGQPRERFELAAGTSFYEWLITRDFYSDILIVVNGVELADDAELDFPVSHLHRIQIFSQPKGVIGKVLNPVFKLVQSVFSFMMPKTGFATAADSNVKESPNNRLTGQTNVARPYQAPSARRYCCREHRRGVHGQKTGNSSGRAINGGKSCLPTY